MADEGNVTQLRSKKASSQVGVPGTAVYGGYVEEVERESALTGSERYRTFSQILANTSIAAAGVRQFLNLVANVRWTFEPGPGDPDGRYAELTARALQEQPETPWHRVVRRAAMYRFYGFSVQEWTWDRARDGSIGFLDIAPRPQSTIERWGVDAGGKVTEMYQRSPQDGSERPIPRWKTVYVVDDTLSDSPTGLGLFRHIVAPARRLQRYEQLEGFGFETDLRGIPVARGPFTELKQLVKDGKITQAERVQIESNIRSFVERHVKGPKLGLLLDSMTYETKDEAGRPSNVYKWDADLLKGGTTGLPEIASAIERINLEIARTLGVEGLLVGGSGTGSLALSRDKTRNFFLIVDGTLTELSEGKRKDLILPLFLVNGWPLDAMPTPKTESVRHSDVEQVTASMRDMALAGAPLATDDPVINEVRSLLGVPEADLTAALALEAPPDDEDFLR